MLIKIKAKARYATDSSIDREELITQFEELNPDFFEKYDIVLAKNGNYMLFNFSKRNYETLEDIKKNNLLKEFSDFLATKGLMFGVKKGEKHSFEFTIDKIESFPSNSGVRPSNSEERSTNRNDNEERHPGLQPDEETLQKFEAFKTAFSNFIDVEGAELRLNTVRRQWRPTFRYNTATITDEIKEEIRNYVSENF